jgi:hypothetical protein
LKLSEELECAFGVVGKILLDEQDLMKFYLVRLGFRMCETWILK